VSAAAPGAKVSPHQRTFPGDAAHEAFFECEDLLHPDRSDESLGRHATSEGMPKRSW
jgi:hypothetical protein